VERGQRHSEVPTGEPAGSQCQSQCQTISAGIVRVCGVCVCGAILFLAASVCVWLSRPALPLQPGDALLSDVLVPLLPGATFDMSVRGSSVAHYQVSIDVEGNADPRMPIDSDELNAFTVSWSVVGSLSPNGSGIPIRPIGVCIPPHRVQYIFLDLGDWQDMISISGTVESVPVGLRNRKARLVVSPPFQEGRGMIESALWSLIALLLALVGVAFGIVGVLRRRTEA